MELNDFIEKFAQQFDETDASEITADCVYKDLDEWSSMAALAVIAFIRTTYGKSVTGMELRSCNTVNELFTLVSAK